MATIDLSFMKGPRVLQGFNLFVDGRGYAGKVSELERPKLTIKTEEFRAGGMDVPVQLDMGMEAMECSFTLTDYDAEITRYFGLGHNSPVSLIFRGSLALGNGAALPVKISMEGMWKELDGGTWKSGDALSQKVTVACRYYKEEVNGETITEIDAQNMVRIVDGVDMLAATRANIGM